MTKFKIISIKIHEWGFCMGSLEPMVPAAAAADSRQEFAKHLYNHRNISLVHVVTHMVH
jgi:hypothetical protein